jgi:3-(3-hydroxy-phenyl)propionate hydroxylase
VAGFGPAGAVCANLLGQLGLRTLVVERNDAVYDKPRAFAFDHEIMRVFQNIGVAEAVLPHTAPFTPSEYYGASGQLIKRLGSVPPPYPLGWPPNVVFNQPAVEKILRERAGSWPSVEIELGMQLEGFEIVSDSVLLRCEKGKTISCSYLVGCDGAASTVRQALGIGHEDLDFDEPWLVVDLLVNERGLAKLPKVSIQYCEPARPATYLVGPGNHRRWEIMLLPGEEPRRMEAEVWRLLSRWLAPEDAVLWRAASYRFHALVAETWRRGPVFIAGDAAHQQPPFTGQGMCQGIRDVANLSWKLAAVLRGEAGAALLDSYEAERKPHVKQLTTRIKDIGRVICERDAAAAAARDRRLITEAGGTIPTVPRQDLIPPLQAGFLSPLGHPANGTLFPQPRLRGGSLMDDVVGSGWRTVHKGEVVESEGVLAAWFERHQCSAALVRPDHYVYGVARDAAELARQEQALHDGLRR